MNLNTLNTSSAKPLAKLDAPSAPKVQIGSKIQLTHEWRTGSHLPEKDQRQYPVGSRGTAASILSSGSCEADMDDPAGKHYVMKRIVLPASMFQVVDE